MADDVLAPCVVEHALVAAAERGEREYAPIENLPKPICGEAMDALLLKPSGYSSPMALPSGVEDRPLTIEESSCSDHDGCSLERQRVEWNNLPSVGTWLHQAPLLRIAASGLEIGDRAPCNDPHGLKEPSFDLLS